MAPCDQRSISRAPAAAALRGRPRKLMPKARTKQARRRVPRPAPAARRRPAPAAWRPIPAERAEQDGLEDQPFRGEAVERRQRRNRHAADQEGKGGARHAMDQPAQTVEARFAGRGQHRAGAEEQQALEQPVIEDMEQGSAQRQRRRPGQAIGREGEGEAEPDEDDADVLDRAVGEHALQVDLHQRVEHAEHRRDGRRQRSDQQAPPPAPAARPDRTRCG